MKNIKFLFALLLFVGMNANASESINGKEELIKQLSVDESFIAIMTNNSNIKLTCAFIGDVTKMSPELIQDIKRLKLQNVELRKIVEDKYPAYKKLSVEDKKEVISTIFNTSFSQTWFECAGQKWGNMLVCAGILGTGYVAITQALLKTRYCFSTALAADIAQEEATNGAATAIMEEEMLVESIWCARLGYTVTLAVSTAIGKCMYQLSKQVVTCGGQ